MTRRSPPLTHVALLLIALLLAVAGCSPSGDAPSAARDEASPAAADTAPIAASAPRTAVEPAPATAPTPTPDDGAPADPALAEAAAAAIPDELASFECVGADPAWTLALSRAGATLQLDGEPLELGGDLRPTPTGAWTWLGAADAAPDDSYALLLSPSTCFPGEGQRAQPYIAELSLPDGRRASGCCAPAADD